MNLDIEQINSMVFKGGRKSAKMNMQLHEDWVRMHADTSLGGPAGVSLNRFRHFVETILPPAKVEIFESLLRFPLPTTAVTSVIFDRLSRIFEGRNPVYNYQFTNPGLADDWEWFRQEVLDEPNVWKTKGWEYFKTRPNSVIVVDMPEDSDPSDRYVQPYFYWVTIEDIEDYRTNERGEIEWIVYKNDDRKMVYAVDGEKYVSKNVETGKVKTSYHGLGYCPATFFVDQSVSLSTPDVKKSPITDVLSELDWYLFFLTSEKHLNLYASYPILSGYEANCGYDNEKTGEHCMHGMLFGADGEPALDEGGHHKACPICGNSQVRGAGTFITVPQPGGDDQIPDMIKAVQMLKVDRDSLDFNSDKAKALENAIINKCVGTEGNVFTEFSISEKQVDANYESQSTILVRVKKIFENAQWFVDQTVCRLRYGKGFVAAQIDYGTEFYTLSTEQLRKRYSEAKEGGANQADLLALRRQIIETEYRTNPLELQRMTILSDVEPLLGCSAKEAVELLDKQLVDESEVKVKVNFDSLIKRFERENGNVAEFGLQMQYRERVEAIKKTLIEYTNEQKHRKNDPQRVQQVAE